MLLLLGVGGAQDLQAVFGARGGGDSASTDGVPAEHMSDGLAPTRRSNGFTGRYSLFPRPVSTLASKPILALAAGGRHSLCVVAATANLPGQDNNGAVGGRRSSTDLVADAAAAAQAEAGQVGGCFGPFHLCVCVCGCVCVSLLVCLSFVGA